MWMLGMEPGSSRRATAESSLKPDKIFKVTVGAGKMAWWVKAPAAKSEGLTPIPVAT